MPNDTGYSPPSGVLRERRADLVDRLAAASRMLMFSAGVNSPNFEVRKAECVSLRAAIADIRREIDHRELQMSAQFKPFVDEAGLIVHEGEGGVPSGSCSCCPQLCLQLVLIGTPFENLADLRDQFSWHFNAVHAARVLA
jgi:hypothetical protein